MSWEELKPKIGKAADNIGVRISMGQFFTITIGEDVAAELHWKARENVRLLMGKGEHHGVLRLVPERAQFGRRSLYMLLPGSKGASTLKLRMRKFPGSLPGRHDIERVKYLVSGEQIDITLPGWAAPRAEVSAMRRPAETTAPEIGESFIKPLSREQLMRGRA